MPGLIHVRELSPQEVEDLRVFMRTTRDARLFKRATIIWLSHLKKTVADIARDLDLSPDTIREWVRRYEDGGLDALDDEARTGRPPRIDKRYLDALLDWVPKSPRLAGLPTYNWTLALLAQHLETETGIRIGRERIRRILLEHRIRFRRPKLHLVSDDPDYDAKVDRIRRAIARAGTHDVVLFEDECDVHLNPSVTATWQDERLKIEAAGRNKKRHVFGAVDIETGHVLQRITRRKTAREFVAFLRQLRTAFPTKRILIVLDNFAIHSTTRVGRYLDQDGRIRLLFLPTYSPQLNPIEPWWRYEKRHVLANVFHQTIDAAVKALKWWYRRYRHGTVSAFGFKLPRKLGRLSG